MISRSSFAARMLPILKITGGRSQKHQKFSIPTREVRTQPKGKWRANTVTGLGMENLQPCEPGDRINPLPADFRNFPVTSFGSWPELLVNLHCGIASTAVALGSRRAKKAARLIIPVENPLTRRHLSRTAYRVATIQIKASAVPNFEDHQLC